MATEKLVLKNRMVRMNTELPDGEVFLKNARISEGLSKITETRVEFLCSNRNRDLQDILGTKISLEIDGEDEVITKDTGYCVSVEYIGLYQGLLHLVAEIRPWLWFLTKTTDCRIFQEMTAMDIIKSILSDHGYSAEITDSVHGDLVTRPYCVQYRETDFDFISRLMEEEGIYYFFKHIGKQQKMVLTDSISGHSVVPGHSDIDFHYREENYRRADDHIFDWTDRTIVTSGKVTLEDFDFEKPRAELKTSMLKPKGKHGKKTHEMYDYPGHYKDTRQGGSRVRVKMEAEAVRHQVSSGVGNVRSMQVGGTFKLKDHPRVPVGANDFLVLSAVHLLQIETEEEENYSERAADGPSEDNTNESVFSAENKDTYRCRFEVFPKIAPFRAPLSTPWPEIAGLHTAIVTGPKGEEIYTDEHGRIKVQFHWDREGKKDEKTTCWIRVATPWSGKNWGMIAVPRIGQEVVVQFEEGNPDRPICTGMLYNAETMPPYPLPANMTQSGIVTRSTKEGSSKTFNELIFEDKKDAEFVRMQSEKDYKQTIKNNAEITIGLEKKDDGDLTQTIHRNKTETLNTGDHSFTVKDGNQTIAIKKDHTETIEGKSTQTITKDTKQTIKMGNYTQTLDQGNVAQKVKMGNFKLDTDLGKIDITAMQSITLKVGGNSIKIDQSGVTIKGLMVKIEGQAMLEAKSPMTTVKGDGMLILKGGMTMIN